MRRKSNVTRLASTRDVSGKYANSPYPYWMKALESKYQKLHTKIMQSTSVSTVRQLKGPLRSKRTQDTLSRLSNRGKTPNRLATLSGTDISLDEKLDVETAVDEASGEDGEDTDDEVDNVETLLKAERELDKTPNRPQCIPLVELYDDTDNSTATEESAEMKELRVADAVDASNAVDVDINMNETNVVDVIYSVSRCGSGTREINSSRSGTREAGAASRSRARELCSSAYLNNLTAKMPTLRNVSRTSNKTSKSCPAVLQPSEPVPQAVNRRSFSRERGFRSKRKHVRLFERMSLEAQHAINETLLEMDGQNSSMKDEQSSFLDTANNNEFVDNQALTSRFKDESFSSSKSCVSSSCASNLSDFRDRRALREDNCMFPSISNRYSKTKRGGRKPAVSSDYKAELRIPGIGKYNIARLKKERTFQITYGDFDIRYREIITVDRTESVTPPPEIRQKAIAKCNEWLAKYTPR